VPNVASQAQATAKVEDFIEKILEDLKKVWVLPSQPPEGKYLNDWIVVCAVLDLHLNLYI
jgi:hypothetical protein